MHPSIPSGCPNSPAPSAPPLPPPHNQPPSTGIPVVLPPPLPPPHNQPPFTGISVVLPPPSLSYTYTQLHQYQIQHNIPIRLSSAGKWSTGLFGCCSDCSTCWMTCVCPCVTFGQIADIIDRGSMLSGLRAGLYGLFCLVPGCACLYSSFYRTKMRKRYLLPEQRCSDFGVHFCCECCALCQEHRHLKSLGFEMSIGWRGNMEKQILGLTAMSPVVFTHGMVR